MIKWRKSACNLVFVVSIYTKCYLLLLSTKLQARICAAVRPEVIYIFFANLRLYSENTERL
jgi:hypothetical protein